jgi:archaellum component FlaC
MANLTIAVDLLKTERDRLSQLIDELSRKNDEALGADNITLNQHSKSFAGIQELENTLNVLNIKLISTITDSITISSNSPGAKISSSIDRLDDAIESIENTAKILSEIATVINAFQSLINIL